MDINNIVLSGKLTLPAESITSEGKEFVYFSMVSGCGVNGQNTFVKVLLFNSYLIGLSKQYIVNGNQGKKLAVAGKLALSKNGNIQVIADSIFFIDKFKNVTEINDSTIDFSDDERTTND